jgi:hypothetical protein
MIEMTTHEGRNYYTATRAGVQYTASCDVSGWHVHSHRLALGRSNYGSVKRFASLAELAAKVKALRGLDVLAQVVGGAA